MRRVVHDNAKPTVTDDTYISPEVARQAVRWFLDLQASDTNLQRECEWQRWRAADPMHELAWQRIERVSGKLRSGASPFVSAIAQAKLTTEGALGRRHAVKVLVVLFFGGNMVWGLHRYTPWREMLADYRTAVGEIKTIMLADGTKLMLNTASAINVRYDLMERRLVLVAGEVFITTVKAPIAKHRPFIVETAQGDAQALGTEFSVRQQADDVHVAVFDGAVNVCPREIGSTPVRLQAGEQADFTVRQVDHVRPVEENARAWTRGMLVVLSMRLENFLAELQRYSTTQLTCDPAVADLHVSGSYPTTDVDKVLQTLPSVLPVQLLTIKRLWGGRAVRLLPLSHSS